MKQSEAKQQKKNVCKRTKFNNKLALEVALQKRTPTTSFVCARGCKLLFFRDENDKRRGRVGGVETILLILLNFDG